MTEVRTLAMEATDAMAAGDLKRAYRAYAALEKLDPENPEWPKGAALVFRRFGQTQQEIDALNRAARAFVKRHDLLKAILVVKQIITLDPLQEEPKRWLASLHARAGTGGAAPARSLPPEAATVATKVPEASTVLSRARTPPPEAVTQPGGRNRVHDAETVSSRAKTPPPRAPSERRPLAATTWIGKRQAPISDLKLREVMPGARARPNGAVYEIPLDSTGDVDFDPSNTSSSFVMPKDALEIDDLGNVTSKPEKERFAPPSRAENTDAEDALLDLVAEEVRGAQRAQAVLPSVPLFATLDAKSFDLLFDHSRVVEVEKDQEVFHQGDVPDALYVIADGQIGIVDEGPPQRAVAKLKDGDVFGEIGLFTNQPRTATALALSRAQLIAIDREAVHQLLEKDAKILPKLLAFIKNRLVDRLLLTNPLFTVLSSKDREAVKKLFRFLEADEEGVIFKQGEVPSGLFVVLTGELRVEREQGSETIELARLQPGDVCGEMSLVRDEGAIAAVVASKKSHLIEMPREHLIKILKARPEARSFIEKVIAERREQAKAILSGSRRYAEGRVRIT